MTSADLGAAGEMQDPPAHSSLLSRRHFILGGAGVLALAGGAVGVRHLLDSPDPGMNSLVIGARDPLVGQAEAARPYSGRNVDVSLTASPATVDLAGRQLNTWLYGGRLPGAAIRVRVGDELRVRLINQLPEPTTVHWHGLALRNDMDGVPDLTMDAVLPGGEYSYRFRVPHAGTYWFHSHVGVQRDRGLSAPLIVEDPDDPGRFDHDIDLMLDDWTDGWDAGPDEILARLKAEGPRDPAIDPDSPWGPMLGEVAYPAHLINGHPPRDPATIRALPGQRIRLRLINAAADTTYRVALTGHRMTVTHADGWPVSPVTVDTLLVGMGERYDVLVTVGDGVFALVAAAEGKSDAAVALVRTGAGAVPAPGAIRPAELNGRLLDYTDLRPRMGTALPQRHPDRTARLLLSKDPRRFRWLINNKAHGEDEPTVVRPGERLRLDLVNASAMAHPMHVHGHTFALAGGGQPVGVGTRKDTVVVLPGARLGIELDCDNPGQWLVHCHNAYHMAAGMMTSLSYQR